MPILLLIRHGENDYVKKDKLPGQLTGIHLNAHGREQADALARTLGPFPIQAIYSSPLERAIETATPLSNEKKLKITIIPALIDTNVGKWAGRSWKTLQRTKDWKVIQDTPSQFSFPDGESFAGVQRRILAALETIIAAHGKDEMLAIIFHGDPIKLALAQFLCLPLDNFQRLSAYTGSVSIIKIDGKSTRLLACNLIPPFTFPIT
jgi:probable phosphoglycerate mutase